MLNKSSAKQTLVAIVLLAAGTAWADPPAAWTNAMRFGDWRLDCGRRDCPVHTAIASADGSEVLRVAVAAGGAPSLTVLTPLPLFLPDGLVLVIGEEPDRPVPWRTCGAAGCEARLPLDPELLAGLKRERTGSVGFTLVDGEAVRVPFSLVGFTAALRARDAALP